MPTTQPASRERSLARIEASNRALDEATIRLDRAIEGCPGGIPVTIIDEDDSLAVSMAEERAEAEALLQTNRSRRAMMMQAVEPPSMRPRFADGTGRRRPTEDK